MSATFTEEQLKYINNLSINDTKLLAYYYIFYYILFINQINKFLNSFNFNF